MKVALTGATGFLGSRVAKILRDRDDQVVALVRRASQATILSGIGCEILEGNTDDRLVCERLVQGADAVIHMAGRYEVGIPKAECPKMQDTNIGGTRRIVDAAITAGIPRIVYVSSIVIYGDTGGQVVDEDHKRDPLKGFTSCYDESKFRAHLLVQSRVQKDAPIISVAPGSLYGTGDHSEVGREILQAANGQLRALMLADIGLTMVHADDAAAGVVAAFDKGRVGETYNLGGETKRLREILKISADLAGRKLTKMEVPTSVLQTLAPIGPFVLPKMGYPPNLGELIRTANGVTYWASDEMARTELGYTSRPLQEGLRQTLQAAGITPI